ncbi:MAG: hypothetical protein LBN26_09370 [Christensenellaceae bacterium]|jgi:hypothetical protein|nr:hypothetical protein [Christensenellaceae bacterium]
MKKKACAALALLFIAALLLAGCEGKPPQSKEGVPLFDFLKDGATASFVRNFEKSFPISVGVASFEYADSGDYRKTTDAETIRAVFSALSDIRVFEKIGDSGTAYYMETIQYIFQLPNDKQITFGFHEGDLIYKEQQRYSIEGYYNLRAAFPPPGGSLEGLEGPGPMYQPNGSFGNRPGNTANGGWVVEGMRDETYVAAQQGVWRVAGNGAIEQLSGRRAGWLSLYGPAILLYCGYDADTMEPDGIYAVSTETPAAFGEVKLYDGYASALQIYGSSAYFLTSQALVKADISGLEGWLQTPPTADETDTLAAKPISWGTPAVGQPGYDASGLPHDRPTGFAIGYGGVYVALSLSGARYEEFVYVYSLDGAQAEREEALTDIACRNMFFTQDDYLFFRYTGGAYDTLREDVLPGIYGYSPGNAAGGMIFDEGDLAFTLWTDITFESIKNAAKILLVAAGDGGITGAGRTGLYTIDMAGEMPGEPVQLYDSAALLPNLAGKYIYFCAPTPQGGAPYAYYRIPIDGLSGVERLDFDSKTIEAG